MSVSGLIFLLIWGLLIVLVLVLLCLSKSAMVSGGP